MHILTEKELIQQALPALRKIFINDDIYSNEPPGITYPFSSEVLQRKIIFPCGCTFDDAVPPAVLVSAATYVGDKGCYFFFKDWVEESQRHCYVLLEELSDNYIWDIQNNLGLDNLGASPTIVYSEQGLWGLMTDYELIGLLGGNSAFIKIIEQMLPNINKQVFEYLGYYLPSDEMHNHTIFLSKIQEAILIHVYGEEETERIFQEYDLYSSLD